jgi:ribonuclease R
MKKQYLQGTIKRHPDGFGFFIPDESEHPDVYVPRQSMNGVMTNDKIMIDVFPEKGGQRFRGEVIRILSRGTTTVVGTYHQLNPSTGIVRDDGKGWGEDLKIPTEESKGAAEGELVSVEITNYPDHPKGFRGKVSEVIGNAMDPLTDIRRVLLQNHIPHEFPAEVESESRQFSTTVLESDMKNRHDLRKLSFITIDGATAKDFDDAIYIESNSQGFKLYVAIADVSHYVRPGTAIDKEAYERGTSVYFPNFVVPMLPEVLSNGLCSLKPHVARLSLVAEMQMNFVGEILDSQFYEAVIESKARVTYGEAQEVIDGESVEKLKHVQAEILRAADLAKILMAKRSKEGSLDLEIPETQIVLDSAGIPIDFIRSERLFAHRLIEEMMLSANVAVARFLSEKEIAAIYRIHEPPNEDAIAMLEKYLANFGSRVKVTQGKLQKRLTKALQEFEGKPEAQILNILTLRSMSQAKYSANNLGHFGLGFEFYTHFTSPIRRYPDLIVHRLLKSQIMARSSYRQIAEEELQTSATMLSACEQRSVKAERLFQSIKKARFMQKFIGEEFEGLISSVTKFGVFVLLRKFEVDGLVRSENLSKEKLEFDEESLTLTGVRSGMKFQIGDLLTVRVDAADPESGQVDFGLAGLPRVEVQPRKQDRGSSRRQRDDQPERSARRGRSGREERVSKEARPERGDRPSAKSGRPDRRDRTAREERRSSSKKGARGAAPAAREERPVVREARGRDIIRPADRSRTVGRIQEGPQASKRSRKANALDQMEDRVVDFLSEANTESTNRGEAFDPEKHLQTVLKKWKERNSGMADKASAKQHAPIRREAGSSSAPASKAKGKSFFDRFRKKEGTESEGGSGKGKASSNRGKRK